jgi:hypothetical protein
VGIPSLVIGSCPSGGATLGSCVDSTDVPEPGEERAVRSIRRLVFIVSPGQRELYNSLKRTFAGDRSVEVILDRRSGQRRQRRESPTADRRRIERRRQSAVQTKLAARGYALVGVVAAKESRRS